MLQASLSRESRSPTETQRYTQECNIGQRNGACLGLPWGHNNIKCDLKAQACRIGKAREVKEQREGEMEYLVEEEAVMRFGVLGADC